MGLPVSAGLQAGATVFGATGAYYQTKAQNKALAFQARLADQNRERLEAAAQQVKDRGRSQALRQRTMAQQFAGKQRVAAAAAGVRVDAGSPGALVRETARFGEEDAIEMEYNAFQRAAAIEAQASSLGLQADTLRASRSSPWLSAAAPLLGGGARLAGMFRSRGGFRAPNRYDAYGFRME